MKSEGRDKALTQWERDNYKDTARGELEVTVRHWRGSDGGSPAWYQPHSRELCRPRNSCHSRPGWPSQLNTAPYRKELAVQLLWQGRKSAETQIFLKVLVGVVGLCDTYAPTTTTMEINKKTVQVENNKNTTVSFCSTVEQLGSVNAEANVHCAPPSPVPRGPQWRRWTWLTKVRLPQRNMEMNWTI